MDLIVALAAFKSMLHVRASSSGRMGLRRSPELTSDTFIVFRIVLNSIGVNVGDIDVSTDETS